MSRVYIVRHGNTFDKGDIVRRVGRRTDLPLSTSGRLQAQRLKAHLQDISFGASYSSDLKRTCETLEIIIENKNYKIADMLSEIDYGPDEGQAESDVIARLGEAALRLWDEAAIPPKDWHVDPDQIRQDWTDFLARLPQDENTLVVTSNGTARFLLDVIKGGQQAPRKLRTGSYGIVYLAATGPELEAWNIRTKSE